MCLAPADCVEEAGRLPGGQRAERAAMSPAGARAAVGPGRRERRIGRRQREPERRAEQRLGYGQAAVLPPVRFGLRGAEHDPAMLPG